MLSVPHGTKQNFQKGEIAMISTKNVMSNILSIISKKCKGNIILMTTSINDLFFEAGLEEKLIKSSNPYTP